MCTRFRSIFRMMTRRPATNTLFPYTTLFRSYGYVRRLANGKAKSALSDVFSGNYFNLFIFVIFFSYLSDSFRSEEHTSELQSRFDLVCRLLLAKKDIVDG